MAAVTGAADRLKAAARATGVLEGDPLAVLVEILAEAVQQVTRGQDAFASSAEDLLGRLALVLAAGRETASAEADRFRAELAASEIDVVRRIGKAIAEAADMGMARRARAMDRRTALLAALALAVALVGSGLTGWWTGRDAGRNEALAAATDLRDVLRQKADVAAAWRNIIAWNDLRSAIRMCQDPANSMMVTGRKACRVPLWISPAGERVTDITREIP